MDDPAARRQMSDRTRGATDAPRAGIRRAAVAAFLVALALFAAITVLGMPLRNAVAPLGIVSLQFAADPAAAQSILDSWSELARSRLLWVHGLDLLFPIAYALAIGLVATDLATRVESAAPSARLAAGAGVMAALADQIENLAMFVTILFRPTWFAVLATRAAAGVKFVLLVVALLALLATFLRAQRAWRTGIGR
jgi:hypothetical protein